MTSDADVIVLGGGSGGYATALRSAQLGRSVILIEQDKVGGTCLHRGCIPTKAMLHAAEVADLARHSESYGIDADLRGINVPAMRAYMDGVIEKNWKGLEGLIESRNIRIVRDRGTLTGPSSVSAGGMSYAGEHVVLATGSRPSTLPGVEPDGLRILTSEDALTLASIPDTAIVLGGGVIGCEFASAWTSLGSKVTIVEALSHLIPLEDEHSSRLLERAFRRRGIDLRLKSRMAEVHTTESAVQLRLEDGSVLEGDVVLIAIGREAVIDGADFAQHGIALDRRRVKADQFCRTSVANMYAVGDLLPTLQLAHVGFAEGILAAEHSAGLDPSPIDYTAVPRVTYSSPEVASVGLTEAQARDRHGETITTAVYDLSGNGRSAILGTAGAVKLVATEDGTVIGIHMVGDRVSELVAEAQLIVTWEAVADDVAELIHPHPTQSEAIGEAHMLLAGRPLHVH
ncbi:dihydrolipoyl dehydrogenase [Nocardioides sp. PD653]|nr:dihydrolipoyl dehydrogenase [Nocardioides sp. PD653]